MKHWTPRLDNLPGPLHQQLFRPLQQDIFDNILKPGDILPPQRKAAQALGLSLGTVSKAYQQAFNCGLVEAHVGRGTLVSGIRDAEILRDDGSLINLQTNLPPLPLTRSVLLDASQKAARTLYRDTGMHYPPVAGLFRHRDIISSWMTDIYGLIIDPGQISLTLGALQGLSLAIAATSKVGQKIYGEPITFAGIKATAHYLGRRLCPLAMDKEGILPEAFEQVARERPGVTLVTVPTLQNPTNITYTEQRREQLAAIAQKYNAWIIESDIYRFLAPDAPVPIHTLAPDRTLYINSFSKCLSPDLRVGLMITPEPLLGKIQQGLQAGGWSIPPLSAEIICQLLQNGEADRYMDRLRQESLKRMTLVNEHLGEFFPNQSKATYHMWMECTLQRAEILTNLAREQNILLTPPRAITLEEGPTSPSGIRLCLGSEQRRQHFYFALKRLKQVFAEGQDKGFGII